MKVYFVNPPFKAEHGKFARENRSAAITRSGTLYYPLWLIYAAAVCEKDGFDVRFLDAPATPLNYDQSMEVIDQEGVDTRLFVVDTSTPSICSDIAFADALKAKHPEAYVMLVGTHPSVLPEETLGKAQRVDAVALKEFDYIVRDVARALRDGGDPSDVLGLAWCDESRGVTINESYPFISDLDEIPFAAEFIKKHLDERDYFSQLRPIRKFRFSPAAVVPPIARSAFILRRCTVIDIACVLPKMLWTSSSTLLTIFPT